MKNLALSNFDSIHLKTLEGSEAFCQVLRDIYVCGKGKIIKSSSHNLEVICNLTDNLYPVLDDVDIPKAVDLSFCHEKDLLYVILLNGDIVSLHVNEVGSEDIVGSVDDGIKAAQWSPTEELVALVTGKDNVVVMTQNFDPVSEVNLHSGGFGEKQFITVGWGKKETQFRGSEGKFNAKEKTKEETDFTSDNNNAVMLSWRGDSEYFAISCINPDTSRRYLRIFSKNGILQYTSEDVTGVEHPLHWSPSGSLIASTLVYPNKYVVCFFEKNGLKHGEFKLPFSSQEIKVDHVLWNNDSKVIAILISKISDTVQSKVTKYIQLYTISNYHWYCKYTINFDSLTVPISMKWDKQKSNTLYVTVQKEKRIYLNKYSWLWTINKSKGSSMEDESLVAVIDGCDLKVTSFKRGIIPPPMSTHQIHLPDVINAVSFAPDVQGAVSSNDLLVQLSNDSLLIFKFADCGPRGINFELLGELKGFSNSSEICYNIHWTESNTVMLCVVNMENEEVKPFLSVLNIDNIGSSGMGFKRKDVSLNSTVALLKSSNSSVVVYTNTGELYSFSKNEYELNILTQKDNLIDLEIKDKGDGDLNYFALDSLHKFYVNNNAVLSSVLSFHLHENFILVTTMKHELLCFDAETQVTNGELSEVCTRRVERGSKIVTSTLKDSKVILQMPRGNLECIQPRALSLFVLGKYLDSSDYFSAFDLMRKQRINLNLLYDHNPDLFSKNVDTFLKQMKDLHWISLFVSELSDEDVTQTMYSVIYKNKTHEVGTPVNKVDTLCDFLEKALTQNENPDEYLLPQLMCHIKRGKTEFLEKALAKLKQLKEREESGEKPRVSFDEAFRYVLYLIDVDELYKVALGMYDFDLVLIIANKSQKDPKEYLEFLNELKQLETNYRRYRIDKYLKRYKKALANLVMCEGDDVFNECINFIKTHKLYKHALKLTPENTDRYKNICMCYADELMESNSYEEAGFMYSNAGSYKNAMEAYRKAGNWQEVLFCGKELKLDENEINELYLDLAMELSEVKNFKESAVVYLDYLKDVEESVRTLSKGKLFAEACRIAHLHSRRDLISQIIAPEIKEQGHLMELHISSSAETFIKQKNRLRVVRKQKAEVKEDQNEFDDLYSETNTIITRSNATSRTTNRTYRSAKNRRKQERKLLSLKEGSPYEDLALVTSLHNIATNCIALKSEVRELDKFLLKIGEYEMAEKLQTDLEDFLKVIESAKSEIWTPDLLNNRQVYGPDSTSNEKSAMYTRGENVTPVLLNLKYAIPPETQNNSKWQLEIFKP